MQQRPQALARKIAPRRRLRTRRGSGVYRSCPNFIFGIEPQARETRSIELALTPDVARAQHYGDYAVRILNRLLEDDFLAGEGESWEGILKHGSYHEGKGLGVDESVMWGDYFLLDSLDVVGRALQQVSLTPSGIAAP